MYYYKYSDYLKKRFGRRVHKVSVDAGFSCPNRDGKIGTTGCIYCDNKVFSFQNRIGSKLSVEEQIASGIKAAKRRYRAEKFIVYFQAFTNTYADAGHLKSVYDKIRKFKDIVSLSIATRPDCVDREILNLIASYSEDYEVWIEYGLQSIHDKTLDFIKRGHHYNDFLEAFSLTRQYPIKVCVHIILGLPGETEDMMMETAAEMSRISIDGIKIHPLHVVKFTALEKLYIENRYTPLSLDAYQQALSRFIKCLSPDIVIQRLSAYCPREMLAAPAWVGEKHNPIPAYLSMQDTCGSQDIRAGRTREKIFLKT
jgi:uncharacterized protein